MISLLVLGVLMFLPHPTTGAHVPGSGRVFGGPQVMCFVKLSLVYQLIKLFKLSIFHPTLSF